jgi:predicted metalloprotease with PDZ domain
MRNTCARLPGSPLLTAALTLAAVLYLSVAAAAQQRVRYEVAFPNLVHHEAEISVTLTGVPLGKPLEVRMSRSSPGRYALHEFAKNVYNVRASDGAGRPLVITRPNPHQWNVAGHRGRVRVEYTLFGDRADGTYTGIDNTHAHLNMPATFMWARGMDRAPIRVTFRKPVATWRIATQLAPTADPDVFTAPNLQYFMDSPTEIGPLTVREWIIRSSGKAYTVRLAIHHAGTEQEADAYVTKARRIVDEEIAVFGEPPAFDHGTYTFIADYLPHVEGDGMEHRNSTILTSSTPLSDASPENLWTLSHEFFHCWNVERIRPRSLEPFNFEEANMSGELWFAEGFTSYYDGLFLRRAGILDDDAYVANLAGTITFIVNSPGRQFFSAIGMSRQAPFADGAESVDPTNFQNTFISYYPWGAAIGLGLDLTLRSRFTGITLDDYMRAIWRAHGKRERPYTNADLRRILGTLTGDEAFASEFFRRYIEGKETPDYEALLGRAGLLLRRANPGRPWLGGQLKDQDGKVVIDGPTFIGGPLYRAGLDNGDRILRLDGKLIGTVQESDAIMAAHRAGDTVEVEWEQRGETRRGTVLLAEDPKLEVVTYEKAGRPVSSEVRSLRERWLRSHAP